MTRSACHLLLDAMPEEGLKEVFNFLFDVYAFYITPRSEPIEEPKVSIPANMGKTYDRPEFHVEDD